MNVNKSTKTTTTTTTKEKKIILRRVHKQPISMIRKRDHQYNNKRKLRRYRQYISFVLLVLNGEKNNNNIRGKLCNGSINQEILSFTYGYIYICMYVCIYTYITLNRTIEAKRRKENDDILYIFANER